MLQITKVLLRNARFWFEPFWRAIMINAKIMQSRKWAAPTKTPPPWSKIIP